MSDRIDALRALKAKVQAGGPWPSVVQIDFKPLGQGMVRIWAQRAYHGDLNAAYALHERVLPGCSWKADDGGGQDCPYFLIRDDNEIFLGDGDDPEPARAWLIAILTALIAIEEQRA